MRESVPIARADLFNVGARRFAKRGNRVDRRDSLGKKRVRDKLGKFGGPKIRRQNAFTRHPPGINRHKLLDCREAFRRLFTANQNAIRILQILHRRALREKLRIRENLVIQLLSACAARIVRMVSAVFTGIVLFSTMIFGSSTTEAIMRATASI